MCLNVYYTVTTHDLLNQARAALFGIAILFYKKKSLCYKSNLRHFISFSVRCVDDRLLIDSVFSLKDLNIFAIHYFSFLKYL